LALLEIANRPAQSLQASDLGFAIGPRFEFSSDNANNAFVP
jgi:single-stranded DNA-specific DHH superfamily exonuclease